jgi:hypothetical protein
LTARQWALVNEFQALVREASVTLRMHKIAWKRDLRISLPPVVGVLVTVRVEPVTLRREYAVPDA